MQYKVESGIPYPVVRKQPVRKPESLVNVLGSLKIGQSVGIPVKAHERQMRANRLASKMADAERKYNITLSYRTVIEKGQYVLRIWRIKPEVAPGQVRQDKRKMHSKSRVTQKDINNLIRIMEKA